MKRQRTIIIKNPRLRKIRDELRALLNCWLDEKIRTLQDTFWNFSKKGDSDDIRREIENLQLLRLKSIIYCPFCGGLDKDMIYMPHINQWICIDCNSERIYFSSLSSELNMSKEKIKEFLVRLEKDIKIDHSGSKCNGYRNSKKILIEMNISEETQKKLYKLLYYYGGHCDCEILFNARARLLDTSQL